MLLSINSSTHDIEKYFHKLMKLNDENNIVSIWFNNTATAVGAWPLGSCSDPVHLNQASLFSEVFDSSALRERLHYRRMCVTAGKGRANRPRPSRSSPEHKFRKIEVAQCHSHPARTLWSIPADKTYPTCPPLFCLVLSAALRRKRRGLIVRICFPDRTGWWILHGQRPILYSTFT